MAVSIPACSHETKRWFPAHPQLYSRSEVCRQTGEYNSTIPGEVAIWEALLPSQLIADVADAERALTEFDTSASSTLGTNSELVIPMSAILLRTESASSSQIENLTASAKQIALAELDESRSANALTIIGNVRAMEAAIALSTQISESTLLAMHEALLHHQKGYEDHGGRYREELVWIGGDNAGPRGAQHIAPQHERISTWMRDLLEFISRDDIPVLIQAAISHAQFETIHPFVDGNGRTGRALVHAVMRNKGLVSNTTVPLSAGLLVDQENYFRALGDYRQGDAEPIIKTFAQAARFATVTGQKLVDDLSAQLQESKRQLDGIRTHASAWKVLPYLVSQPIVNAKYLKQHLGFSDAVTHTALATLTERKVLVEKTGLRRNRVWQHARILGVLDDYAKQIRRKR